MWFLREFRGNSNSRIILRKAKYLTSRLGKNGRNGSRRYSWRIIWKYWWRQRIIHTKGALWTYLKIVRQNNKPFL